MIGSPSISIQSKVLKGASWLALFKAVSQIFSWLITIIVARILVPDDYGLMEMATIITGYAFFFSELGLGAAIIQKQEVTQEELSSVFWFGVGTSVFFSLGSFAAAYPTAMIFNEPRVMPITCATSVLFLIGGLQVVPMNLLKKELRFKDVGIIEMTGVFVSGFAMLIIAYLGGGVWTLIGGHIIRALTNLIQTFTRAKWFPIWHYEFRKVRLYLRFGISVAVGASLFYLYSKSDKIFGGRALASIALGYYSLALQLAQLPTEKIVVLINQVSFSAFSQLQGEGGKFKKFYLNITKITATFIFPIFIGGFLVGGDIIRVILNDKWLPIIPLFEYLCIAQIMTAMNAVNNFVHAAQGRPNWSLYFNALMAMFLPFSFYLAVQHGLNAMLLPWFTTYLLICTGWILITLRKIGISLGDYGRNFFDPLVATLMMAIAVILLKYFFGIVNLTRFIITSVAIEVLLGASVYTLYLWWFDRDFFEGIKNLIRE